MPHRFGARHSAVQREPRPDEVEPIVRAEADSGAIRQTGPPRRHRVAHGAKPIELHPVHHHIFVGTGEMAHQRIDLEPLGEMHLVHS